MSNYQSNRLAEFEPFFGKDPKGSFLVQGMFTGTDYTTSNTKLPSGLLVELLRAENYRNYQNNRSSTNGQSQGPADVHQDVTDLIITTALFHRSIDKSSTAGTNLGDSFKRITSALKAYLSADIPNQVVASSTIIPMNTSIIAAYGTGNQIGKTLMFTLADRAAFDAHVHSMAPNQLYGGPDINGITTDDAINHIVNCTRGRVGDNNVCFSAVYSRQPSGAGANIPSAIDAIEALATANPALANVRNDIVISIQTKLRDSLRTIVVQMKQEMLSMYPGITIPTTINAGPGFAGQANPQSQFNRNTVTDYMDARRQQMYIKMLSELIDANVMAGIRKTLTTNVTIPHTDLSNADVANFFNDVYKNWGDMSQDARSFYRQNISVFAKSTSRNIFDIANDAKRDQERQLDWIRLTEPELDALAKSGATPNTADIRVNLMKNLATNEVLFASNLPDVPSGATVWYSQRNGGLGSVSGAPSDFFRKLYDAVYADDIAGNTINVRYPTNAIVLNNIDNIVNNRPKRPFDHDLGKFLSAVLRREDNAANSTNSPVNDPTDTSLDVYPLLNAVDMVYGHVWTFDTQRGQYFRTENGRKVYYDDAVKNDANTCYASYLAKGRPADCPRVIQCIADGNPQTLSRCLDVLRDNDLWKVAEEDAAKVGPDIVRLVLKKFGIGAYPETDSNGLVYNVPMSYDEWMRDIVGAMDKPVRDTITGNYKLLSYIKGLLSVCRSNPSIINKNNPQVVARENIPLYMQNLNMKKYTIPSSSKRSQYEFFAESLKNAAVPRFVENDLWNPIISGSMSNVSFFSPYTSAVPSMMGGAPQMPSLITPSFASRGASSSSIERQAGLLKNGSSSIFHGLVSSLTSALNDVGLSLHHDDVVRIRDTIKKMEKYEDQLAKMCIALNNFVKLARAYGVSLDNVSADQRRVIEFEKIRNVDDIAQFISTYVRDITKNMASNMTIQQATSYELMSGIAPRYLKDCVDKLGGVSAAPSVTTRRLIQL
jgi:hypothetical protein